MINSIIRNLASLRAVHHRDMQKLLAGLDEDLLIKLRDYLEDCYQLRLHLSVQDEPTLCGVIVVRGALLGEF